MDTEQVVDMSEIEALRKQLAAKDTALAEAMAKAGRAEFKLQTAEKRVEELEKAQRALPPLNEVTELRKRVAELEAKETVAEVVEPEGPECEFGYFPHFDKPEGREAAAKAISKKLSDGWVIAHEDLKESIMIYVVRFERGRRNNPRNMPLVEQPDRQQLNIDGLMAGDRRAKESLAKRQETSRAPLPMMIEGTVISGGRT